MNRTRRKYFPGIIIAVVVLVFFTGMANAQFVIQDTQVTDVTPSGFSVVWLTSEPAEPLITVYSDAEGINDITSKLEITPYPMHGGNPSMVEEYYGDEYMDTLRDLSFALGIIKVGIHGCSPGTDYFIRVGADNGEEVVWWPDPGTYQVTTMVMNSFVVDAEQLLVKFVNNAGDDPASGWADGLIAMAYSTETSAPISSFVGDGAGPNHVFLNLSQLFYQDGLNWTPVGTYEVTIEIIGYGEGAVIRSIPLEFTDGFHVASLNTMELNLDGPQAGDNDGDGYTEDEGDCNDNDDTIYPGAEEICGDGIDQDCDGYDLSCDDVDNDGDGYTENQGDCDDTNSEVWQVLSGYVDGDGDGYGTGAAQDVCSGDTLPSGYADNAGDCDDTDAGVNPGATEILDNGKDDDCNPATPDSSSAVDNDEDGYTEDEGDCNDNDATVYPGAEEICGDGIDQDCDGYDLSCDDVDNDGDGYTENQGDCDDTNSEVWQVLSGYVDGDGDGYGTGEAQDVCSGETLPAGYAGNPGDCDDTDAGVNPGATEIPDNGKDDDCNPDTPDDFRDIDDDGDGYTENQGDCDDSNAEVNPGAEEIPYNGMDDDCDPSTPDDDLDQDGHVLSDDCNDNDAEVWQVLSGYVDGDGDGYGTGLVQDVCSGDTLPSGYADNADDCDDTNSDIWQVLSGYVDGDGDGYGIGEAQAICSGASLPAGYADNPDDCDDENVDINPDAFDVGGDGIDQNCYGNDSPVADAGADIAYAVLGDINLDGSNSFDTDADSLSYIWEVITEPSEVAGILSDSTAVSPVLTITVYGEYVISLIVNDGFEDSALDTVTVSYEDLPPVADAGEDMSADINDQVCLDGSGSFDPNNDTISYEWAITAKPAGSLTELDNSALVDPCFTPDTAGEYQITLIVNDGNYDSEPDTVLINVTGNVKPVADAGEDGTATVDDLVCLNGSGSYDPNDDPITYEWAITAKPADSLSALDDPEAVDPCFIPDKAGDYVIQLIVNDGLENSEPATVLITVEEGVAPEPGDLDGDGTIDVDDYNLFRATLGKCEGDAGFNPDADYDGDGCITYADYRIWYGYYRNQ